jgi:hypothetical protein
MFRIVVSVSMIVVHGMHLTWLDNLRVHQRMVVGNYYPIKSGGRIIIPQLQ